MDEIEEALADFIVTTTSKPNLSSKELLKKFPEFNNDEKLLEAAYDYKTTVASKKYEDNEVLKSKFPEFFQVKKKDGSEPISQEKPSDAVSETGSSDGENFDSSVEKSKIEESDAIVKQIEKDYADQGITEYTITEEDIKNYSSGGPKSSSTLPKDTDISVGDNLDIQLKGEKPEVRTEQFEPYTEEAAAFYDEYLKSEPLSVPQTEEINAKIDRQAKGDFTFGETIKAFAQGLFATGQPIPIYKYDTDEALTAKREEKNKVNFLEALPEEKRIEVNNYAVSRSVELDNETQNLISETYFIDQSLLKVGKEHEFNIENLKKMKQEGGITEEAIEFAIETEEKFKGLLERRNQNVDLIETNKEDIGTYKEELNLLKRNYHADFAYYGDLAGLATADILLGLVEAGSVIDKFNPIGLGDETRKKLKDRMAEDREGIEGIRSQMRPLLDLETMENGADFGRWMGELAATQLPIITTIAAGGGIAGPMALGSSIAGQEKMKLEGERTESKEKIKTLQELISSNKLDEKGIAEAEKEIEDLRVYSELSDLEIGSASIAVGTFEMATDMVMHGVMTKGSRAFQALMKDGGKKAFEKGVTKYVVSEGVELSLASGQETLAEGGAQLLTNVVYMALGDKDTQISDGVLDGMAAGGMMGFMMRGGGFTTVGGLALRGVASIKQKSTLRKNNSKIASITLELEMDEGEMSDSTKRILKAKRKSLIKENRVIIGEVIQKPESLGKEKLEAVTKLNSLIKKNSEEAKEIIDSDVSEELKQELLKDLYKKVEKNKAAKEAILGETVEKKEASKKTSVIDLVKSKLKKANDLIIKFERLTDAHADDFRIRELEEQVEDIERWMNKSTDPETTKYYEEGLVKVNEELQDLIDRKQGLKEDVKEEPVVSPEETKEKLTPEQEIEENRQEELEGVTDEAVKDKINLKYDEDLATLKGRREADDKFAVKRAVDNQLTSIENVGQETAASESTKTSKPVKKTEKGKPPVKKAPKIEEETLTTPSKTNRAMPETGNQISESQDVLKEYTNSEISRVIKGDKKTSEDYLGEMISTTTQKVQGGTAVQEVYKYGIVQKIFSDDGSSIQRLQDYNGKTHGIPLIKLTMDAKESGMFFDGKKDFKLSEKQISDFFNSKFETNQKSKKPDIVIDKTSRLDDLITNIDKALGKIDEHSKDTLGMNIPVVIARTVLKAMKLAAVSAKTTAEVLEAGLKALKDTKWFKNLSKKLRLDVEQNFEKYINKPFNDGKKTRRFMIEEEVDALLDEEVSEKEILKKFVHKKEKEMVKDYLTRKNPPEVTEAFEFTKVEYKKYEDEVAVKETTLAYINRKLNTFMAKWVDRQYLPKKMFNLAGGEVVRNYMIAQKGSSGRAKFLYDEAYAKIYRGLSSKQIKVLDMFIFAKRVIAIDENRSKRGAHDVMSPGGINLITAKAELQKFREEVGEKVYKDYERRANEYFKVFHDMLQESVKSGLISKENGERFFEVNYQPRRFIKWLKIMKDGMSVIDAGGTDSASLSKPLIQSLEEGSTGSIIMDSMGLLSRSLNVTTQAIAVNDTNKRLSKFIKEQSKVVEELKKKANPTKKERGVIKAFKNVENAIALTPIVGFTKSGNPKYAKRKANQKSFKASYYYVDGVKHQMLMEKGFHDLFTDAVHGLINSDTREVITMLSLTGTLKSIATGNNPAFFITNTPKDIMFTALFSEEYRPVKLGPVKIPLLPLNIARVMKDSLYGIAHIETKDGVFRKFIEHGGMLDFLHMQGQFKGTKGTKKLLNGVFGERTRDITSSIISYATFKKLQLWSEVGTRVGIFTRSIQNSFKDLKVKNAEELRELYKEEAEDMLQDIYKKAIASARGITDFNQGGLHAKSTDAAVPYFNPSVQGTRVATEALVKEPAQTTLKIAQAAAMVATIPVMISLYFIGRNRGGENEPEEDRDLSDLEIYIKAKQGVSRYDRVNYMTVFTGGRVEGGEFPYFRLAKSQFLTPFTSWAEGVHLGLMKEAVGDESKNDTWGDVRFALEKNVSPIEFGIAGNVVKNPLIAASVTLLTGEDLYREEPLSYLKGRVQVATEGHENKNVEKFYKNLGLEYNMSPARVKGAAESIITTPRTSPIIGLIYGGLNASTSDAEWSDVADGIKEDVMKAFKGRIIKETSPYNRLIDFDELYGREFSKLEIADINNKAVFKDLTDKLLKGELDEGELKTELIRVAEESPFNVERMFKIIQNTIEHPKVDPYVYKIKFSSPAQRAIMLYDMFGGSLRTEMKDMSKTNKVLYRELFSNNAINLETLFEFDKLIKRKEKESKK
tara:strand:+ start:49049 stop:55918 length:6870 start_codon:yes stop_codon:yes gene_type:complete